jgi:hypothetical protein
MNEFPNIIATDIINSASDVFWKNDITTPDNDAQKPVLILSNAYPAGGAEEVQLQKMLQACTLTVGDYHVVQLNENQRLSWHFFKEKFNPKFILLIGLQPAQLGIHSLFNINIPNHFGDAVWIPSLSISDLEKQPEMKKQLWLNALKPAFVDKSFGNI